jgi:hypothetical protein
MHRERRVIHFPDRLLGVADSQANERATGTVVLDRLRQQTINRESSAALRVRDAQGSCEAHNQRFFRAFTSVKTMVKAKPAPATAASRKKIIAKPG